MHFLILMALASAAAPAERPKLLVLDFKDDGAGESNARVVRDILVAEASRDKRLDVISTEDMRRALDVDAQKRAVGSCSEDGCVAEIANALGAQLTMYGTAGKLGDLYVVNVILFDARTSTSVGRETVEGKTLGEMPGPLRAAADRLIGELPGFTPLPAAASSSTGMGVVAWTGVGVAVVGAGTGVVAGIVAAANQSAIDDAKTSFVEKTDALHARNLSTGIALVGAGGLALGAGVLAAGLALE